MTAGSGERRTETEGWVAAWRLVHWSARIVQVSRAGESFDKPIMNAEFTSTAPDLAEARERFPDLWPLWDAIRHEYWAELTAPNR